MFDPIPHSPRYRLAAEALIARIRDGSLAPGQKLPPDRVLVAQLGISRPTLREALIALEVMGYIETRFGAGAFVSHRLPPGTSHSHAHDDHIATEQSSRRLPARGPFETLEARRLIEGELAALAAEQITPSELDQLWDAVNRLESAEVWEDAADQAFHAIIAKAAGNSVLAEFAARFWEDRVDDPLWAAIETAVLESNRRPALVAEHETIIEALTEGNASAARDAMHKHLDRFTETLLSRWDTPEQYADETVPRNRLSAAITRNHLP